MTGPAPYHRDAAVTVYHGDCLDVLPALDAGSVDAVITDPPYALNLTGREQGRPATTLGRLAEGDRAPCTSTLVACPPGCGRPRGRARQTAGWRGSGRRSRRRIECRTRRRPRRRRPVPVPPGLPIGSPRSSGGAVARSSSSANRPITRQARSVRALHALRRDVGGPLSVHYWRMSTHTTPHRPDNRQRSSHPGSAGDEDPVPGRSTMAEIARAAEEADR